MRGSGWEEQQAQNRAANAKLTSNLEYLAKGMADVISSASAAVMAAGAGGRWL